jgi:Zn-dependent protease with chaperone function
LLISAIENFVLLSTLFALVCFIFAGAVHNLRSRGILYAGPDRLAGLYTSALIIPPVAAAWLVIAALLPEWLLSAATFSADHGLPFHDLHLLGELTASLEPALAYMTLTFVLAAAGFSIWSSWGMRARLGSLIASLELNADHPSIEQISVVRECASRHGLDVGLVTASYPFVFVWGFGRSKLVLSTALLRTLTAEELRGVMEHEAAHHHRRDNIVKLLLSLSACSSLIFPLSRLILKWRALEVEMICDDVAVAQTGTSLEIADALIKLRRQKTVGDLSTEAIGISGFLSADRDHFERRVSRLIQLVDSPAASSFRGTAPFSFPWFGPMIYMAVLTTTLATLTFFSPLAVHKAAESLIQLFK